MWRGEKSPPAPIISWREDFLLNPTVAARYFKNTWKISFQGIEMENCLTAAGQSLYQAPKRRHLPLKRHFFLCSVWFDLLQFLTNNEYNTEDENRKTRHARTTGEPWLKTERSVLWCVGLFEKFLTVFVFLSVQISMNAPSTGLATTSVSTLPAASSAFVTKATSSTAWHTAEVSAHVFCPPRLVPGCKSPVNPSS